MIKQRKYATLGIWKSPRTGEIVKALPTFDTREEAETMAVRMAMYEPEAQIAILERDPNPYDEYDHTREIQYNFLCAFVPGKMEIYYAGEKGGCVVQPCWILDETDEELPKMEEELWILDEDGEDKKDLKELFFPLDFLLAK